MRNTPARPLLAPHIRRNGARLKKALLVVSAARDVLKPENAFPDPSPLTDSFLPHTLDDWNTRKTAGVGDVLEAVGLRARWNAYHDEPELA